MARAEAKASWLSSLLLSLPTRLDSTRRPAAAQSTTPHDTPPPSPSLPLPYSMSSSTAAAAASITVKPLHSRPTDATCDYLLSERGPATATSHHDTNARTHTTQQKKCRGQEEGGTQRNRKREGACTASIAHSFAESSSSPLDSLSPSLTGCVKGDSCDFVHPTAPDGSVTNHVCSYFGTSRGCAKQNQCPYLHAIRYNPAGVTATRVCDFYLTSQGCVKGNTCNYLHPKAVPAIYNMAERGRGLSSMGIVNKQGSGAGPSSSSSSAKECRFVNSPEGCRRGDACQFAHPGKTTASSASTSSPSVSSGAPQRKPNVLRGGVCSRGLSIVPSIHKIPKVCQYWQTKEGCKKGDLCDFVHMQAKPCTYFAEGTCKKGASCDFVHSK